MKAVFNLPERPNPCKTARISIRCSKTHYMRDPNQLASLGAFFHLAVDQAFCHLPTFVHAILGVPPCASVQNGRRAAEKYKFKPSLVKRGRQPGASICRIEWMSRYAMCCVRGPNWKAGRSLVQGSMATHSHNTCFEHRSLVRNSSSWRCGSQRWRKERSWKVCACEPARVRRARDGRLPIALRPVPLRKDPVQRLGQSTPWRPAAKGFSDDTKEYGAAR